MPQILMDQNLEILPTEETNGGSQREVLLQNTRLNQQTSEIKFPTMMTLLMPLAMLRSNAYFQIS